MKGMKHLVTESNLAMPSTARAILSELREGRDVLCEREGDAWQVWTIDDDTWDDDEQIIECLGQKVPVARKPSGQGELLLCRPNNWQPVDVSTAAILLAPDAWWTYATKDRDTAPAGDQS